MQLKLKLHRDFLSSQTATLFPAVSKTRHAEVHGGLVSAADTNNDKWQRQSLTHNYSHSKQIQIIHLQSSVIFPIFLKKESWETATSHNPLLLTGCSQDSVYLETDSKDYPLNHTGRSHLCHLQLLFGLGEGIKNTATAFFMDFMACINLSRLKAYTGFSATYISKIQYKDKR